MDIIKQGVRYDPNYRGTGYREESDLQLQVRKLGYKIIYDPRLYVYHLCFEEGGNRFTKDTIGRFYWKARNNAYFVSKNILGLKNLLLSSFILNAYAAIHGLSTLRASYRGLREGLLLDSRLYSSRP